MFDKMISRRSFLTISAMAAMFLAMDKKRLSGLAEKISPKNDYPVVVIGAGLGGLCTAAYLVKDGFPVTVIEQHLIPGGYATSFSRGSGDKYTFDVSLHGTALHNTPSAQILDDLGILKKLNLVLAPECYRLKKDKLDITVPQRDPESYIQLLSMKFPKEAKGIKSFVNEMINIVEDGVKLSKNKGKFIKVLFPIQYKHMWNVRNKTLEVFLGEHVKDPELKDALSGLWGYYGLPPSKLSAFYYAIATGEYLKYGLYYIKDRSQNLSDALADTIIKGGGKILYGTEAKKILTENKQVKGVEISGDKTIPARIVVSNASAPSTFFEMLPQDSLPNDYLNKIKGYKPSLSSFIVWLGLNRELGEAIKTYTIHVPHGNAEEDYKACLTGDIENSPFSVTIYDNLFKGYSKSGCSTVSIITLCGYDFWSKFESYYKKGEKDNYYEEKERWTKILIKKAEKYVIPGLSSMMDVVESSTPLTNWYFTKNYRGAIYGYDETMDNSFMNRIENRTPVKGLYLASAWGDPGGGYAGVLRSGFNTFSKILEDFAK
ncbi:MAG TPA: NAD(P)/FAD-dependent oxidoreductase [Syntrophorhabdaceae bacterium]|nr:NAD(P)/FAD-dependent oxidoreductase [Syntrophorhabdaceae bacterium]